MAESYYSNVTWSGSNTNASWPTGMYTGSATYIAKPVYTYNSSTLAYEASPEGIDWMRRYQESMEKSRIQQMRAHHRRKLMMARERKIAELWAREW